MDYYYVNGGDVLGPSSLHQLREMLQRGELAAETQVATEGSESWQSLSSLLDKTQEVPIAPSGGSASQPAVAFPLPPPFVPPPKQNYEYTVVPFVAAIRYDQDAGAAAAQLAALIHNFSLHGWEYVRLENVETHIAGGGGCFGFGADPPRTVSCSMAVFRK